LKKFCAQERPVPSQVVVKNSLYKNSLSVCSKIICQINAKLGLSLWVSQIPENLPKKVMLIGADVHHGKKGSVIGLCASFDDNFTKYYSRIKVQKKGQEIMTNISSLVSDAIKKYFQVNKGLPETIIFYRDGVGEGQFKEVREIEIPAILQGFAKISPEYKPKFCEVIVTKKINDRFFTLNGNGGSKYYNPPSGTWVAEQMVSKNYDFFLCAQNVTQGTCTPTHYTVLYNDTNLAEDTLAKLTYYQCFNYFNWTGAIRVPACVQYSSKLAFLVGQTLQADPHESLWDKLYFL
jgi:aubergine-like protein